MPPFAPKGIPPDWQQMPDDYWDILVELGIDGEVTRKRAVLGRGLETWFYAPGVRQLQHDWLVVPDERRAVEELAVHLRQAVWNDGLVQRRRT